MLHGLGRSVARASSFRRVARAVASVAGLSLTAGLMVILAPPAHAVACGGAAQNGLAITANHDAIFYTDFGDGFDAAYVGYQVTNSGAPRSNLWITATNFLGGVVSLADSTDDRRQITSLGAAASATRFFHAKAAALTSVPQAHTITVYDRRPDLTGATALATCDFSFSAVEHTIGANANKVTTISSSPASPAIGGTVTVTVTGQTGQATGAIWISPAALSSWPTKALRLESTAISVNTDGIGPTEEFYSDTLYIPSSIAAFYTSQTTYEATYVFRVTRATSTDPVITPVAQIHSGGAFKHTGSFPTLPAISTSSASASVTVGKTITAADVTTLPTTTAPNGIAGATTYVEVPYRIIATSTGNALVDEFVDVPATGVLFKNGSAVLNDATPYVAEPIADPSTSTTDPASRAGALHFTGPYLVTNVIPATIDYTMYIPLAAGTYTNQAFATLGGTTIGASPSTIPYVSVTSNGAILTSWTNGFTGSGSTAQSITFAQPADAASGAGTHNVTATASSGLGVTLTSSTTGVCTVAGSTVTLVTTGTCTISANQPGDATYAAAPTVTRSFAVTNQTPQTITFTQPSDVSVAAGTRSVGATATSGLTPTFSSSTPTVCSVAGTTVTLLAAGTCTISADQAGNGTYSSAPTVVRSFAVQPLPAPPAPNALTSTGGAAAQSTTVVVPAGGSVTLLDGSGTPTTVVVASGEGTYALDTATGTITFVPFLGFSGSPSPVSYRVIDVYGQAGNAIYTPGAVLPAPVVGTTPDPVAPVVGPTPGPVVASPVTAKPILNPSKTASSVTVAGTNGTVSVGCQLSVGDVEKCVVTLYAIVSGQRVIVGSGSFSPAADVDLARVTVSVALNALGRALAARPQGTSFTTSVAVTVRGSGVVVIGQRVSRVVAKAFVLPRPVFFSSESYTIRAADRRYLAGLRRRLSGVKSITCIGYTDSRGSHAYDMRLGKQRATAVCRYLTRGTGAAVRIITRGKTQPHATNVNSKGRALNRRTSIRLTY